MAIFMAVDPGGNSGWALYVDKRLHSYGLVPSAKRCGQGNHLDHRKALAVMQEAAKMCTLMGMHGTLVVESQFLSDKFTGMVRTVEARAWWEGLADLIGWQVERTAPNSWQGHAGLLKGRTRRKKTDPPESPKEKNRRLARERKHRKDMSVARAKLVAPDVTDDNVADAINMGEWWLVASEAKRAGLKVRKKR